jgi:hypothetical protein
VNPLCEGRLQQRRGVPALVVRNRLGGGLEGHGVPEAFELGDEPLGVGFVAASAVPVGSEVVVGLVAMSPRSPRPSLTRRSPAPSNSPVPNNQDGVPDHLRRSRR